MILPSKPGRKRKSGRIYLRNAKPTQSSRWQWLARFAAPIGLLLFLCIAVNAFQSFHWSELLLSMQRLDRIRVGKGLSLVVGVFGLASSYELLTRRYERHAVSPQETLAIGFLAYTWAATVSSVLGNWGTRYRFYLRKGLSLRQTTRIAFFSVSTNWAGFVFVGGLLFLIAPAHLPLRWLVAPIYLRIAGAVLLICTLSYLALCFWAQRRSFQIRGLQFKVPTPALAVAQIALSSMVWIGLASIVWLFLPDHTAFRTVLSALVLSAFAGMAIRVPAGIGVIEVVFVGLLKTSAGTSATIFALLVYRGLVQVLPLMVSALVYFWLEFSTRSVRRASV